MSRRRKPDPFRVATTRVVCTDEGQHPSAEITILSGDDDFPAPQHRTETVTTTRTGGGVTYTFTCPRCRRSTRLRDETLHEVLRLLGVLTQASAPWPTRKNVVLDISDLPC